MFTICTNNMFTVLLYNGLCTNNMFTVLLYNGLCTSNMFMVLQVLSFGCIRVGWGGLTNTMQIE